MVHQNGVKRSFCIKADQRDDTTRPSWPSGKYCVYKKGKCPKNMSPGFVYWDDDSFAGVGNSNAGFGILPDGIYDTNTKIEFCCRTDGKKKDPVTLPVSAPFFLLAYESAECQQVKWAIARVEWILFDNEDFINYDNQGGSYPYGAGISDKQHKIHYCYYKGCNITLTEHSGTFQSPYYPKKYPDGQYCSWKIAVNPNQIIHLKFTSFSLQVENNSDAIYVYNGENETGEAIGVFYGGHPPPQEGIKSSSNNLFVIFKSDVKGSFAGFNASYSAVNHSVSTSTQVPTTIDTSSTVEMTSSSKETNVISASLLGTTPGTTAGATSTVGVTRIDYADKDQGQSEFARHGGVSVAAIIISLVGCLFLALAVAAGFLYFRRRMRRKDKDEAVAVTFQSSRSPPVLSLDNAAYQRPRASDNVLYSSREEESILYAEVREEKSEKSEDSGDKETDNPLYEALNEGLNNDNNAIYDSLP